MRQIGPGVAVSTDSNSGPKPGLRGTPILYSWLQVCGAKEGGVWGEFVRFFVQIWHILVHFMHIAYNSRSFNPKKRTNLLGTVPLGMPSSLSHSQHWCSVFVMSHIFKLKSFTVQLINCLRQVRKYSERPERKCPQDIDIRVQYSNNKIKLCINSQKINYTFHIIAES